MSLSFALSQHFERFIDDQLASGKFKTPSEVVQAGLQLLQERERNRENTIAEVRSTIEAGRRSGSTVPAEEVFEKLERKIREKLVGA